MPKRAKGCSGKVRHASKVGACIAARRMKNVRLNVYLCPACGGWHVGKSSDPIRLVARIDQLLNRHASELGRRKSANTVLQEKG